MLPGHERPGGNGNDAAVVALLRDLTVDERDDRVGIDPGSRVDGGDGHGLTGTDGADPNAQGRRSDVVHPVAEGESARASPRRAVEDHRIVAGQR
jgi:hypothetical protein